MTLPQARQPVDEQADLHRLSTQLLRADDWMKRVGAHPNMWASQKGSELSADNIRTKPYQIGHRAIRAITVAVDHLYGLRLMILGRAENDGKELLLPSYAPYPLLRASMENAATAVWLLSPQSEGERAIRTFRLAFSEVGPSEAAKKLAGSVGPRTKDQRIDRIRQLAEPAGVDPKEACTKAEYTEIVGGAATVLGLTADLGEALWRIGSAFSHGDLWPIVSILDRVDSQLSRGSIIAETSANVQALSTATLFSASLIDRALVLYGERRKRP